jgi:hypothetical protein
MALFSISLKSRPLTKPPHPVTKKCDAVCKFEKSFFAQNGCAKKPYLQKTIEINATIY